MELEIKDCPDPIEDLLYQLERGGAWDLSSVLRSRLISPHSVSVPVSELEIIAEDIGDLRSDLSTALTSSCGELIEEIELSLCVLEDLKHSVENLYNV